MKTVLILLMLFILTNGGNSQTKSDVNKLNSFLKKWSYSQNPAIVLEKTKQILVPWTEFDDEKIPRTFGSINWKELDSIVIYDLTVNMPYIYFYGRGKNYRACEESEKCEEAFFKSKYREDGQVVYIEGRLLSETEKGERLSKEIRQEILNLFKRLIIKK